MRRSVYEIVFLRRLLLTLCLTQQRGLRLLTCHEMPMAGEMVLVVDDDPLMLNVTSRMLTRNGYDVLSTDRPRQALEIVRNSPVHLVLSDVVMPEMQGTQLVREVVRLSPQTVAVLMTGYITKVADVPDDVALLRKPFTRQELICAVQNALAQSATVER